MKKILIIKTGAIGDVVRTSYYAKSLYIYHQAEIDWVTGPACVDLLSCNPYIKRVFSISNLKDFNISQYNQVFSLEEDYSLLNTINITREENISGFFIDEKMALCYTADTAVWNDMGLVSRFGKDIADKLKADNLYSHIQIFNSIFNVPRPFVEIFGKNGISSTERDCAKETLDFGFVLSTSGRWPGKGLSEEAICALLKLLAAEFPSKRFGWFVDYEVPDFAESNVLIFPSPGSVIQFADNIALVKSMFFCVDTLAFHLACAQKVPVTCFVTVTSPAELSGYEGASVCAVDELGLIGSYTKLLDGPEQTMLFNAIISRIRNVIIGLEN